MVFNVTFNNISVISWRLALLVEETGGNHHRSQFGFPLTGLTPSHLCAFPKPEHGFPSSDVVFFMFNGLVWEVVVCFVRKTSKEVTLYHLQQQQTITNEVCFHILNRSSVHFLEKKDKIPI
jgi:hypothetical protein